MKLKKTRDGAVGYLYLGALPVAGEPGRVTKMLRLHDLVGPYEGADINLDFDKDNRLVGIEILYNDEP